MKFTALVLPVIAQVASAHYFFDKTVKGEASFTYVRDFTRATKYNPIKFSSNPAADIRDGSTADGPDIICNQGASKNAAKTKVLTVNAGDEIALQLGVGAKFQHPGPALVYMAKAPGSVAEWDGTSGKWFKIFEEGVCDGGDFTSTAWCSYNKNSVTAKIPKNTPSGEYLARFEHIGVHRSHVNQPEHYVSCLQIKVENGGSGTPGPTVSFPGAYKATDGYANFSIYNGRKAFPMPGPAVWSGAGGSTSSTSGSSNTSGGSTAAPAKEQAPTTLATQTRPAATAAPATGGQTGCAAKWAQCGGQGFTGAKCCSSGSCKVMNNWYSQCQ